MEEPQTIGEILESETPPVGKSLNKVPARCEFNHKRRGKVLSNFTVHYGDFSMKGFRICDGKDGIFIGFPSTRVGTNADGSSKWRTTNWIVNEKRRIAFTRWALNCYDASCKQQAANAKREEPTTEEES
jgi:DNA-binding cell septation regulator SpoVG